MKMLQKIIASLSIFTLLFGILGNNFVYAETGNTSINKIQLITKIKKKQISKDGVNYLAKKRLDSSDFAYLKTLKGKSSSEIKNDTKVKDILNKVLGNGINSSDLSYMSAKGYINFNGTNIGVGSVNSNLQSTDTLRPNIKSIYNLQRKSNTFLQKRPDIGEKVYQVNFKGITENGLGNTLKAGEIQAEFTKKQDFPKQFIFPGGFKYEIQQKDIDTEFVKSQKLLNKVTNLKNKGVDLGNIKVSEPKLEVLPDRIQYVKTTQISFKTEQQLTNIKANLKDEFASEDIDKMLENLKKFNVENAEKRTLIDNTNRINFSNRGDQLTYKSKYKYNPTKGLNYLKGENDFIIENTNGTTQTNKGIKDIKEISKKLKDINTINANVKKQCINEARKKGENINICNNIEQKEKILESKEVIGLSMIPASTKDKISLISLDPKEVRISENEIFQRYQDLGEVQRNFLGDNYKKYDKNEDVSAVYNKESYCDTIEEKEGTEAGTECREEKNRLNNPKEITKTQKLLNGFTIGESKSYSWGTKVKVNLVFTTVKVLELKFSFSYHYAFGVRIPIEATATLSKDRINLSSKNKGSQDYENTLQLDTFDGNREDYRKILKEKEGQKDSKVYGGKEFVFKFGASAGVYIDILFLPEVDIKIPIVSVLLSAMIAGEVFANGTSKDSVARTAEYFGVQPTTAAQFVSNKMIDFVDSKLPKTPEEIEDFKKIINTLDTIFKYVGPVIANNSNSITKEDVNKIKVNIKKIKQLTNFKDDSLKSLKNDLSTRLLKIVNNYFSDKNQSNINKIATALQSATMYSFIKNNEIDLSLNFKPPFGGVTKEIFKIKTPEIILYTDGAFKIATKLGVRGELGGRMTLKCQEVNSNGACPKGEATNTSKPQSTSVNIGEDKSRIHINGTETIKGKGIVTAIKGETKNSLGKYYNYGVKYYDFRYHPILIMTLFTQLGLGANLPYLGWKTYWTPEIDLYTFKFSSDQLYLSHHSGTDGVIDMTYAKNGENLDTNKAYKFEVPKMVESEIAIFEQKLDYNSYTFSNTFNSKTTEKTGRKYFGLTGKKYQKNGGTSNTKVFFEKANNINNYIKTYKPNKDIEKREIKSEANRYKNDIDNTYYIDDTYSYTEDIKEEFSNLLKKREDINSNFGWQQGEGNGNNIYYTISYNKNKQPEPSCGDKNDQNSKEYKQGSLIDLWPNLETEQINTKTAYLNFIICNKAYARKLEFSKTISMEKHTEKARFIGTKGTIKDKIIAQKVSETTLGNLGNKYNGLKLTSYTDNGYIKYAIGNQKLSCKNGEGKKYNDEIFIFTLKGISKKEANEEIIGHYENNKYFSNSVEGEKLKAVKCIKRNDGTMFESYTNLFVKYSNRNENQNNSIDIDFGDHQGIKDKIDNFKQGKIDETINPNKINKDPIVNPGDNLKKDLTPIKKDITPIKKDLTPINNKFNNNLQHNIQQIDNNLKINNNFNDKQINGGLNMRY